MTEYSAGVCNIGSEEIARRRDFGWVSLAATILALLALVCAGLNPLWRLFIFFPAAGAGSGFLQARLHFCSGFARIGAYNFGVIGQKTNIEDEEAKKKDRKRGNQITLYAALIGAAVALLGAFVL